jgi:multisubunit Na+/H+ antiporter MnhB subunit
MTGMSFIVKTITRWVKLFIFLFGVYITLTGHLSPGGGFAGGIIIACSFILLTLAYGKEYAKRTFSPNAAKSLDSIGALLFLLTALSSVWISGIFFENAIRSFAPGANFNLYSAGAIPIYNIAICLKVGAPLFITFVVMAAARVTTKEDGSVEMEQEEEVE